MNWVIARGLQGEMSPIAMAFWRWFIALILLLPFVIGPMRREWATIRRAWPVLIPFGVLGVASFNTLTYTGLKYTTVTNGVLLNSVIPIIILGINAIFLREPIGGRQLAGVLISLAGVVMIVTHGDIETLVDLRLNPGDLFVLAAMVGWAVYTVALRWRPRDLSSRAFTGAIILIGVVFLIPVFAWDYGEGARTNWGAHTYGAVAYFAIFPSVLAYFFWNAGVARIGAERAGLFLHLMPVFGAVLSWLVLGEALLWYHYVGAALIFSGLGVASTAKARSMIGA